MDKENVGFSFGIGGYYAKEMSSQEEQMAMQIHGSLLSVELHRKSTLEMFSLESLAEY